MHVPTFINRRSPRSYAPGFFETHAVAEVIRSIFFSSMMWILLAGGIYTVYFIIAGTH